MSKRKTMPVNLCRLKEQVGLSYRGIAKIAGIHWTDFRRYVRTGKIPLNLAAKIEFSLKSLSEGKEIVDGIIVNRFGSPRKREVHSGIEDYWEKLGIGINRLGLFLDRFIGDEAIQVGCNSESEYVRLLTNRRKLTREIHNKCLKKNK